MHSGVDNDHYAQRDEHEDASRVEHVLEPHDSREYEPGEHDTSEENRTGPKIADATSENRAQLARPTRLRRRAARPRPPTGRR